MMMVSNELEKLILYVGEKKRITLGAEGPCGTVDAAGDDPASAQRRPGCAGGSASWSRSPSASPAPGLRP